MRISESDRMRRRIGAGLVVLVILLILGAWWSLTARKPGGNESVQSSPPPGNAPGDTVSVLPAPLANLEISPSRLTLPVGGVAQLTVVRGGNARGTNARAAT